MPRTIWIFGDQLNREHPAIASGNREADRIVLIESVEFGGRERYHRQRLVLIYSAMRHFAAELHEDGWQVDYYELGEAQSLAEVWQKQIARHGESEVWVVEPNNVFERAAADSVAKGVGFAFRVMPPFQFLVGRQEFRDWAGNRKHLRMEDHYRRIRVEHEILMQVDGEPEGGRWNYDSENRKTYATWERSLDGVPPAAKGVKPDAITREVMAEVERIFPEARGSAGGFWFPVTRDESLRWLERFVAERLGQFGDFQDVMVAGERTMFHSLISPMLNIGLLMPMECVEMAVTAHREGRAPLAAVEGFVRQIIGWREFVNGVYWLKMPDYAAVNSLGADRDLPEFFYTGETEMNCLRETLRQVIETGYNHHIQRLMILGNFLLLAGIRPEQGLRWFSEMYVDAHEWVMAANVLGMALHADGGFVATKPYAASSGYISKMSNYCEGCRFDPEKKDGPGACPFNVMYWAFYDRHQDRLVRNPRTAMMVRSWRKRRDPVRRKIVGEANAFLDSLK